MRQRNCKFYNAHINKPWDVKKNGSADQLFRENAGFPGMLFLSIKMYTVKHWKLTTRARQETRQFAPVMNRSTTGKLWLQESYADQAEITSVSSRRDTDPSFKQTPIPYDSRRALRTKRLVHKSVAKRAKPLPFWFECCLSAAARCRHLLCCTAVKSPSGMSMPNRSGKGERRGEGGNQKMRMNKHTFCIWTAWNSPVKHVPWKICTTGHGQLALIITQRGKIGCRLYNQNSTSQHYLNVNPKVLIVQLAADTSSSPLLRCQSLPLHLLIQF